jgi:tRNA A-37 threonylcarbamoyl transferase component Bud32/tetratricopeptide (TPR) repeat protein
MSESKSDMPSAQNREEVLFALALEKPAAERSAFLKIVCGDDQSLRQRLEALLAAHDAPDELSPKDKPAAVATMKLELADTPDEAVGTTIGRYKLMERLGEGGCGVVYVAEQTVPVRRRVALKVIKLGMDTKQVVARFEAERQALAMMDHPNIAKVLDAGTTETGRPFFVMELVRGIRITDYCDQNQLSTKERLDLFIKVCQAIQHAHQKGIIHRDIKPSNILVTLHDGVPVPKVIDFGIAKATEGRLTDNTVYTQLHQFIGTPAYMSPEQAEMSGLDIDTRSDIYSLGVLLYELLAGSTPFDANELLASGIDQMRKTIREKEPMRPSTKLATLQGDELTTTAKRRSVETSKLANLLRGDLDWIVMKCLEKDRTRRYETANGLAADLKRHLENEPVVARPPSAAYKFQKAFRRNKLACSAGAAVLLVLLLGVIGTTIGFLRSQAAQRRATANFDQARAAVGDMLAVADDDLYDLPGMQPLRAKLMQVAIDRYQPMIKQSSAGPALRAELGRLYLEYGFAANEIGEDYTNIVLPAYNSALAIQRQLVREQPKNRSFRSELGWTIVYARLWHDTNGIETNQPQAVAIFEELAREDPADPFARDGLVWALGLDIAWNMPDDPEYEAKSKRRLALMEQLVKEYPRSAEFRRDLANELNFMAGTIGSDYNAKLSWVSRANELRAENLAALEQNDPVVLNPLPPRDSECGILRPSVVFAKFDQAQGWAHQSHVLAQLKRWPEAISFADRSTAMWRDLVEQNPSVINFARFLDISFKNGVWVAEESGDKAGAQTRQMAADNFWRTHPSVKRPAK